MMRPEGFQTEPKEIGGWRVNVISYTIGSQYYCHIDNVEPGAVIVRTEGPTREEAMLLALAKANERLTSKTK